MKKRSKKILAAAVVLIASAGLFFAFYNSDKEDYAFKTASVETGNMTVYVDATGTIEPEDLVDVGARVSGEIVSFGKDKNGKEIDYSSTVREGDVLALIDNTIPQSNMLSVKAQLQAAKAKLAQAKASLKLNQTKLAQAERNWNRAKKLGVSEALSQSAYDNYLSQWEQATAQIDVTKAEILSAEADIAKAQASVSEAQRNLDYCTIKAPVNGVVIDRKVNVGQTVVSSMSASSLFLIAKDLSKMEVWASVNEADIASIFVGQNVVFTVDGLPNQTFSGTVNKIRLNATMSQNVVTYIVEVTTSNKDGKLLPYMTANLKFEVNSLKNAKIVPNSVFLWNPEGKAQQADKDGKKELWVLSDDGSIYAVKVKCLLDNSAQTAIESPELNAGDKIIYGVETLAEKKKMAATPFVPKMPKRIKNSAKR